MTEENIFTNEIIDIGDYPESPIQESLEYLMKQVWDECTIFIQKSRQEGAPTYFVIAKVPGIGFHTCTCHTPEEAIVIAAETHKYRMSEKICYDSKGYGYSIKLPNRREFAEQDERDSRPFGEFIVTMILPVNEVILAMEDNIRLEMPDTTTDTLSCKIRSGMTDTGAVELMYEEPGLLWIRRVEPRDLEPSHADTVLAEILKSFDLDA